MPPSSVFGLAHVGGRESVSPDSVTAESTSNICTARKGGRSHTRPRTDGRTAMSESKHAQFYAQRRHATPRRCRRARGRQPPHSPLSISRSVPAKKSSWPLLFTRPACPPHTHGNAWHQGAGRWTATVWQDEHNHHPPSVAGVYVRVRLALPRLLAARGQIPALRCRVMRASTALGAHSQRPHVRSLHAIEHARRAGPAMLPVAGRRHLYHHQPSPLQGPSPCAGIQHHHGACLRSTRKGVRSTRCACASKSSASHER